jgi:hypothetical protein
MQTIANALTQCVMRTTSECTTTRCVRVARVSRVSFGAFAAIECFQAESIEPGGVSAAPDR